MYKISMNSRYFIFGNNLSLAGGKYLIKFIFDFKIKISITEILIRINSNKF